MEPMMKITLTLHDGTKLECSLSFPEAEHVDARSRRAHCGGEHLMIRGGDPTIGHDIYTSKAFCAVCLEHLGSLVVVVSTIFGIEEDNRVLNGRCRVY